MMEPEFWLERWQRGEIGFHQLSVQPALKTHWPRVSVAPGDTVLVPLCGKSVDMVWLAELGYRVVGAELSEQAVDAFFSELGVTPDVRTAGEHTIKSSGAISIWCGDFFALDPQALPKIDAVYDRAALVAMPPELQPRYAAKVAELMPQSAQALLIGLDYNETEMRGPPFAVSQSRVRALFDDAFDIDLLDARDGLAKSDHLAKRGVTRLEEATYLMTRRA